MVITFFFFFLGGGGGGGGVLISALMDLQVNLHCEYCPASRLAGGSQIAGLLATDGGGRLGLAASDAGAAVGCFGGRYSLKAPLRMYMRSDP